MYHNFTNEYKGLNTMASTRNVSPDVAELFKGNDESVEMDNPFTPEVDSNGNGEEVNVLEEDFHLNPESTKAIEENLSLPAGQYKWDSVEGKLSLTISKRYIEDDKEKGDLSPSGRLVYNISGIVTPAQGSTGRKGRFFFDISPDVRIRRDSEGNELQPRSLDFMNDSWGKFTRLYFSKLEREVKGTKELLMMVQSGTYYMYITLSKAGGNFLGNLKS